MKRKLRGKSKWAMLSEELCILAKGPMSRNSVLSSALTAAIYGALRLSTAVDNSTLLINNVGYFTLHLCEILWPWSLIYLSVRPTACLFSWFPPSVWSTTLHYWWWYSSSSSSYKNSSEDEIANVNFLRRYRTRTLKYRKKKTYFI